MVDLGGSVTGWCGGCHGCWSGEGGEGSCVAQDWKESAKGFRRETFFFYLLLLADPF